MGSWAAVRGSAYFVAHRGSGDVYPEHSAEGYNAAVALGAQCVEISVGMMSDGVLVCMHDPTFDRTTNTTGRLAAQPSTVLRSVRLSAPQLGPAWAEEPIPRVPLFDDVLRDLGGRVVLCIEAKDDRAFEPLLQKVAKYGLLDCVIAKVYYKSTSLRVAQDAGLPIFAYFGGYQEATVDEIRKLSKRLDTTSDYMVLPAYTANSVTYIDDDLIRAAVATGIPIWVYPLHRRADATYFFSLGVQGAITSNFGYVSNRAPVATMDSWKYQAISAGEVTKDPTRATYNLAWLGGGEISLNSQGAQQFFLKGDICPLADAKASYNIDISASWAVLPKNPDASFVLTFGHFDDNYYEKGSGRGNGYDATLRADGVLNIVSHRDGVTTGEVLGQLNSDQLELDTWTRLRLHVTPTTITWSRLDANGAVVRDQNLVVRDSSWRGGYVHLGRASSTGALKLRSLSVSRPSAP